MLAPQPGYAGVANLKVNLPMISAGDYLVASASYADGAIAYAGFQSSAGDSTLKLGGQKLVPADYVVSGGVAHTSKALWFQGGIEHYWTTKIHQSLIGSWGQYDPYGAQNNTKIWNIGSRLEYNPVPGLILGVEGYYAKITAPTSTTNSGYTSGSYGKTTDETAFRVRVARSF